MARDSWCRVQNLGFGVWGEGPCALKSGAMVDVVVEDWISSWGLGLRSSCEEKGIRARSDAV